MKARVLCVPDAELNGKMGYLVQYADGFMSDWRNACVYDDPDIAKRVADIIAKNPVYVTR